MLASFQEKRPLKKARLGPPDVYPQEAKQREDELTPTNVKHGFATMPTLSDEFGTAHNSNVNASKLGAFFNAILVKKEELMTLQDAMRKKQQINCKDNFWPVSPRTKGALDAWFKDLAGNKPLLSLAKKAPSFNKKEDIFITLCENQVNMQRATWYIKLSAAYTLSFTESKNKKRSIYDPATEWTAILIKFMKELLQKLQDFYQQSINDKSGHSNLTNIPICSTITSPTPMLSPANSQQSTNNLNATSGPSCSLIGGNSLTNNTSISGMGSNFEDNRNTLKYWKYCASLSKYMHEESLLDRQEFLNWILDLLDKVRVQSSFDGALRKLVLILALQYMQDFVQSERLCRKLAYIAAKMLSNLLNTIVEQNHVAKPSVLENGLASKEAAVDESKKHNGLDPIDKAHKDLLSCPHHHDIVLYLSNIIQVITIECPSAIVWCDFGEKRLPSALFGSPLDHIPFLPSALPLPAKCEETNNEIRKQLRSIEQEIALRTKHAKNRWFAEKWLNASNNSYAHILRILECLDLHCFERIDQNNSIETLYASIFPPFTPSKREVPSNAGETKKDAKYEYSPQQDAMTVKILCEWAVSSQRWGEHRAFAVAILLDKRQVDVTSENFQSNNDVLSSNVEDKDSVTSAVGLIDGLPVFQSILMEFLDKEAPVMDENGSKQNRIQFTNLIHLFSTFIRYEVFSYNAYMHILISRGDLLMDACNVSNINDKPSVIITGTVSVANKPSSPSRNFDEEFSSGIDFKQSEFDDSNVDDDLDKLLQNIKEKGQQCALEAPDSPKIPDPTNESYVEPPISRHFMYAKHFAIPQDDSTVSYNSESNQRYILLFGVGKDRDEKKHAVKKISKEISKLFSKKFSIDVAEGGKVKKHSRNEFNFETTTNKCQNMAYFDQHVITSQCATTILEQLNSFALGNSSYLPVQEHVAFLFDLMEMAFNIFSLLELCNLILKELPEVENQLYLKKSSMTRSYTTSLGLYIVGILRRYHSCLLLLSEQTVSIFEGLCKIVKNVSSLNKCSSAERCIFAYLNDFYESCVLLRNIEQSPEFLLQLNVIKGFKDILNFPVQLSIVPLAYNPQILQEIFTSPKRGGKIDPAWINQLQEFPSNVYSFVSNAFVAVCREDDNERLNDISILCAELTASCNILSEEWIAALQSICNSTKKNRYPHLCALVDIHNIRTHNSLAIFICILVARFCFSMADFVVNFALPTLANAYPVGGEISADAEASARLTCHLILKLFKTAEFPQPGLYSVSTSPNPMNTSGDMYNIKLSCDRHLLVGAHKSIPIEAVLAVLKGILIVVDTTALKTPSAGGAMSYSSGKRSGFNTPVHPGSTPKSNERPVDLSQILGTSDLTSLGNECDDKLQNNSVNATNTTDQSSLLEFAHQVLKQICAQEHVLERCLKHANQLCDMIIDDMLTTKQVQRVLHMICYSETEHAIISELDQRSMIIRILQNLEQWTLRISWLDLQLMYRQAMNNSAELDNWLETVAHAAIDVFKIEESSSTSFQCGKEQNESKPATWLVATLVSKLIPAVKGRILIVAGKVLENINYFLKLPKHDNNSSGSSDEREKSSSCCSILGSSYSGNANSKPSKRLLNSQAFLSLIFTCLSGQDEYKENLLHSLHLQLQQCLQYFSESEKAYIPNNYQNGEEMLDALQLRFSLVGGMFDFIQRSSASTTEWATLLTQLVCHGVIDLTRNRELFATVVDMLVTLVHSTLVSESLSERDENKKLYLNLMKKLKKEIGEKNNPSIKIIRQLLPLNKQTTEVITCEPAGVDTKGNKICDMDKKLLRISDKQRISVWDILEGHKNPAPLSWVWFGAVKLERKSLAYEESHRNLKYHAHSLTKANSYYFETLPLPPEDIDPVPDKMCIKDEMKADTPSSMDQQSPNAVITGRGRSKGATRKRKTKSTKTSPINTTNQSQQSQIQHPVQQMQHPQQQLQGQHMQQLNNNPVNQMQLNMQANMQQFTSNQMIQSNPNVIQQQMLSMPNNMQSMNSQPNPQVGFMSSAQQNIQQNGLQQQQPWQVQNQYHPVQQQQFYQQQLQPNRFDRPQINNSKQALSNMLRQRHPTINQNNSTSFNTLSQVQQRQNQGMQNQQPNSALNSVSQQSQFVRGPMRGPNQMATGVGQTIPSNSMLQQQAGTQVLNAQSNQPLNIGQNTGIMSANQGNSNVINSQSNNVLLGTGSIMQQNLAINNVSLNQQLANQNTGQFQNFTQYQQQPINQSGPNQQNSMIGGFNQINQRNNPNDYLAQQHRGPGNLTANRNQYINQAPNVTMNNIIGQNIVPSYSRQQTTGGGGGGPTVVSTQQFQQQRMHQIMQMQNIGSHQNSNNNVIGQSQAQNIGPQQNANLIAQLQRQIPNQGNIMNQQYASQPPPYQPNDFQQFK